jgi:hypothetical protein
MTKYPIDLLAEAAGSEIGGPQEDDIPGNREYDVQRAAKTAAQLFAYRVKLTPAVTPAVLL